MSEWLANDKKTTSHRKSKLNASKRRWGVDRGYLYQYSLSV